MHDIGTVSQEFECGGLSWKNHRCFKSHLRAFAATVLQVRKFILHISTGMDTSNSTIGVDSLRIMVRRLPEKWACLRSDEDLETLNIHLD